MFNVRLAGGHLYGKQLFTWLSLVVSLMASFVLSFSPLDVLDEIWDLIELVSEGILTYSSMARTRERRNESMLPYRVRYPVWQHTFVSPSVFFKKDSCQLLTKVCARSTG